MDKLLGIIGNPVTMGLLLVILAMVGYIVVIKSENAYMEHKIEKQADELTRNRITIASYKATIDTLSEEADKFKAEADKIAKYNRRLRQDNIILTQQIMDAPLANKTNQELAQWAVTMAPKPGER